MSAQQQPPPGWYPDPAGRGTRYWDGARWFQAASPSRNRRWLVVALAAVAVLALTCVVVAAVGVRSMLGPGQDEIRQAADDVELPAGLTLVDETWSGNRLCLEECNELSRRYSSPLSREETYRLVTEAIASAGFERFDSWGGFDAGRDPYSIWHRSGRSIEVTVFSAGRSASTTPVDPSRDVHADLRYW